jgi:hypothetical protein
VLERVAYALHHTRQARIVAAPGDAMPGHHQLQHLGPAEQSHHHRNDADPLPEVQLSEREPLDAALRIQSDHREEKAERRHQEALDEIPSRQGDDEAEAKHGQHQELGRTELQHHRTNHRHRKRQDEGAEQRADERREEDGAQRPSPFSTPGHRVAIENRRRRGRFAGNAKEDRGDVASRGGDGVHAE